MKTRIILSIVLMAAIRLSAQFTLPALPYNYNALEPNIDETTMHVHHDVHHQGYVNNLNAALAEHPKYAEKPLDELMKISHLPHKIQMTVRNNGGGHYNHSLFWRILTPSGQSIFGGAIEPAILEQFGSFENFKTEFEKAATSQFGSGWAWLIVLSDGKLAITSTANQDNPLMDIAEVQGAPILALDVWEHAYYLKYKSKRADYAKAFWNVVNWDEVNKLYLEAREK